ncbi:MAG: hypothetical protein ACJ8GW_03840 [Massilia sp.]
MFDQFVIARRLPTFRCSLTLLFLAIVFCPQYELKYNFVQNAILAKAGMSIALIEKITSALALFSSETRLYALTVGDGRSKLGCDGLMVEAD